MLLVSYCNILTRKEYNTRALRWRCGYGRAKPYLKAVDFNELSSVLSNGGGFSQGGLSSADQTPLKDEPFLSSLPFCLQDLSFPR